MKRQVFKAVLSRISARCLNRRCPAHIPHVKNKLTSVHRPKGPHGSFGIQVQRCKTLVEPKTEKSRLEKAGSLTVALATDRKQPFPHGLGCGPAWPWSCTEPCCLGTRRCHPVYAPVNRISNLRPDCRSEVVL